MRLLAVLWVLLTAIAYSGCSSVDIKGNDRDVFFPTLRVSHDFLADHDAGLAEDPLAEAMGVGSCLRHDDGAAPRRLRDMAIHGGTLAGWGALGADSDDYPGLRARSR